MSKGIEEYIPVGHDNAIKRRELRRLTGLSDREMREHIEYARTREIVILNLQDGNGYFMPRDDEGELVRRCYRAEVSRGRTILKNTRNYTQWLIENEGGV